MLSKDGHNADVGKIARYFEGMNHQIRIAIGIDGYIDDVWQIVASRKSRTDYALFPHMQDFADAVSLCGTGGYSNEIIQKRRTFGGFTANTGNAAARLGADITMLGMFGKVTVDPAFAGFSNICTLLSIGNPAVSHIYEFQDGKIMLPCINEIMGFDWNYLVNNMPWEVLQDVFTNADVVALGYWSLMPSFDEVLSNIYKQFLDGGKCKRLFFDFADIRKRDLRDLEHTLNLLSEINIKIPVTLSLNEHEAGLLFSYMGETTGNEITLAKKMEETERSCNCVRKKVEIDELIVHTPHYAVASTVTEGTASLPQRYCENPVITTGAGDNFNGGYLSASTQTGLLSVHERLYVGNATAGFYVENGHPPDITELIRHIRV